ncbi:MAG: hypothetical protein ABFR36_01465 [Acidobacteriota bacterium]
MKKILTGFIIGIIAGALILFFVNEKWPISGLFNGDKSAETIPTGTVPTGFSSITSKLEKGGDLFVYLNTSKISASIERSINTLKETITSSEKMQGGQKGEAEKWFTFIKSILKGSGLLEISGIGISSKEYEKGFTRSKFIVQHDPDKGKGLFWNSGSNRSGDLSSLDILTEDTVFASFSDINYNTIWKWIRKQAEQSGDDKIRFGLTSMEKDLKDNGIDLNSLLSSINGETGIIFTMDKTNIKEYPTPDKKIKFPDPGFALVIETANDSIFTLLSKKIPEVKIIEKDGVKSISIKTPKMPFSFSPKIIQAENMLIIASRPEIVESILKGAGDKSIRNSEEFKKLSTGMPDSGNGFTFLSSAFFSEILRIQKEVNPGNVEAQNKGMEFIKKMGLNFDNLSFFRIVRRTDEGYNLTTNSTMKIEMLMMLPAIAAGGVFAAVLIPQLSKSRGRKIIREEQPQTPPSQEL